MVSGPFQYPPRHALSFSLSLASLLRRGGGGGKGGTLSVNICSLQRFPEKVALRPPCSSSSSILSARLEVTPFPVRSPKGAPRNLLGRSLVRSVSSSAWLSCFEVPSPGFEDEREGKGGTETRRLPIHTDIFCFSSFILLLDPSKRGLIRPRSSPLPSSQTQSSGQTSQVLVHDRIALYTAHLGGGEAIGAIALGRRKKTRRPT